jgi:predicted transcriptional regulator
VLSVSLPAVAEERDKRGAGERLESARRRLEEMSAELDETKRRQDEIQCRQDALLDQLGRISRAMEGDAARKPPDDR